MTAKAIGTFYNTGARFPVWSKSTRMEVKFRPIARRQAARLYHEARRFERQTRITRNHQDGRLGRNGLAILHALLFDFIDHVSGALFPSYDAIADRASISVSSVWRGLVKLKAAGVLDWVRRCHWNVDGTLEQDSNAYWIKEAPAWRGFAPRSAAPTPEKGTWGEHTPQGDALSQAVDAMNAGDRRHAQHLLELGEPGTPAAALAALNRQRAKNSGNGR